MLITRDGIPDHTLVTEMRAFAAAAEENLATLNLSLAEMDELRSAFEAFDESLTQVMTARAAWKSSVTGKIAARQAAQRLVSKYAKQWRANEAVGDELLAALMLAPHKPAITRAPVKTVSNLILSADGNGAIRLKWDANGNRKGTTYVVETATSGGGPWTVIDAVTKTSYRHVSTPGVPIWFRVTAKRAGRTGYPCMPVTIWAGGARVVALAA